MILMHPLGQAALRTTTPTAAASASPGSATTVMRQVQATSPVVTAPQITNPCPVGREPTAAEKAAGCNRVCIAPVSSCDPYLQLVMGPCGGDCKTGPFVLSKHVASDPAVNTCASPRSPGGRTSDGRLICVQCAPGHVPDPATMSCIPAPPPAGMIVSEDVLPWLDRPLKARMQDLLLPATFYVNGFHDLGTIVSTSAAGVTTVTRDHRATGMSILDALNADDRATYESHKDDSTYVLWIRSRGGPGTLRVSSGTLPFVTWSDKLTGAKVGAFYHSASNSITVKWWDPYTSSDLLGDVIGAVCSVVNNNAAMTAAVALAPVAGVGTATAGAIVATAKLLCSAAGEGGGPAPVPAAEEPAAAGGGGVPKVPVKVAGTELPPGTIHFLDNGAYRIAIPVGATSALQGAWLGQAATKDGSYKEIAPSTSDPAVKGSTLTDKEKFLRLTGQYHWYKDWRYMVPISVAIAGVVTTGTVIVIRRRRRRLAS